MGCCVGQPWCLRSWLPKRPIYPRTSGALMNGDGTRWDEGRYRTQVACDVRTTHRPRTTEEVISVLARICWNIRILLIIWCCALDETIMSRQGKPLANRSCTCEHRLQYTALGCCCWNCSRCCQHWQGCFWRSVYTRCFSWLTIDTVSYIAYH